MEMNNSLFSEIESRLRRETYSKMKLSSTEPKSLYSDHTLDRDFEWKLRIPRSISRNPRQLIAILVVVSREKPFWYTSFLEECAILTKRNNYQGKWRLLHKLAKLQSYNLIRHRLSEELSGNEFFGNYYPYITSYLRNPQIQFCRVQKPRPKKMERVRGYRDKGSKKKPHEEIKEQTVSGPNPEKQDYTSQYRRKLAFVNFLYG